MGKPENSILIGGLERRETMGEQAEMHLDGTLCECCGVYLGVSEGYPVRCKACGADPSWKGAVIGEEEGDGD